jgi:hypothetical protein
MKIGKIYNRFRPDLPDAPDLFQGVGRCAEYVAGFTEMADQYPHMKGADTPYTGKR